MHCENAFIRVMTIPVLHQLLAAFDAQRKHTGRILCVSAYFVASDGLCEEFVKKCETNMLDSARQWIRYGNRQVRSCFLSEVSFFIPVTLLSGSQC